MHDDYDNVKAKRSCTTIEQKGKSRKSKLRDHDTILDLASPGQSSTPRETCIKYGGSNHNDGTMSNIRKAQKKLA